MQKEQQLALEQTKQVIELVDKNNQITAALKQLTERIEVLTAEIHTKVITP